jgi:hypothetical protein
MDYDIEDFDGVFRFTNPTDRDFTVLWNNVEYTFAAMSTSPIIISSEPLERVQEIRKKFAYKLAVREFYESDEYQRLSKMGQGTPPTFDEKILEPMIQQCLKPLPLAKAKVGRPTKEETKLKATRGVAEGANLNRVFEDAPVEELGVMSN